VVTSGHHWARRAEELWVGKALASASFVVMAADFLHTIAPKEFFRPAQVDPG
jgi:hypothetical protein